MKLTCQQCGKRLSSKTARVIERRVLCSACMFAPATRYCKRCGLGPREWMECEEPDCEVETQAEADARRKNERGAA